MQRSPSPRLASAVTATVTSPIQKIITPRHKSSVKKNGSGGSITGTISATIGNDKKHSKNKDSSAQVYLFDKI
jgi:hypothetical protein